MSLADLLHGLERAAEAEVRAIAESAAAEVAGIEAAAARELAERRARNASASSDEQRAVADREVAAAVRRARGDVLAARAAMLSRVFAATRAMLPGIVEQHASRLGPALVAAALAGAGMKVGALPGHLLRCAPGLAEAARAAAPPGLRIELDRGLSGVVIELPRGVTVEATLEALLARESPRLAPEAIALAVPAHREERAA